MLFDLYPECYFYMQIHVKQNSAKNVDILYDVQKIKFYPTLFQTQSKRCHSKRDRILVITFNLSH